MPSFDITSEFNKQEVTNAVDQSKREIVNRYDFKNTKTSIDASDTTISINSSTKDRLLAADQVLREKFAKRNISIKFLSEFSDDETPSESKRVYLLKSGIETPQAKEIVKYIKEIDKKLQASIQDSSIRVMSKKKDTLQIVMNSIKEKNFEIHLTFGNFRD
ncbi:MAG: YajQ family cyclic di-GMP-binding protein [Candidatus Actinomarina sp.]|nr:YajQ family cyclic di-GMP-binding protein [Actinomycetota bacterium]MBL6833123.1 YajQ family cyclic di-GMP-binding protein [Candidatus Actinomarina sp.]MBL6837119.1 YajQ family cyclic di-GMP-binding protein [Candidatus Actinomarina sp.]